MNISNVYQMPLPIAITYAVAVLPDATIIGIGYGTYLV